MASVFKVTILDNSALQNYKDKAMEELDVWFEKVWPYTAPKLFVVDDRKTIDALLEQKTEDWVMGWSWGRNAVFILNPANISTESCHDASKYNYGHLINMS